MADLPFFVDLQLHCTSCGFIKVIFNYPATGVPPRGTILDQENISIFKTGCLRCGTCRFRNDSDPPAAAKPTPPPGWVPRHDP